MLTSPAGSLPVALAVTTAFFTVLHALALRITPENPRAFAISRGVAAAILTLFGLAALVDALPAWDVGFLYRQAADDWMRLALIAVYGHLVSDFLWMAWSRWRHGIRPRKDLILHHGLGILGYGYALWIEVGYAACLIAMITEVMPVTSGIGAYGKSRDRQDLIDFAARARLAVLCWLRLPVWAGLFVVLVRAQLLGTGDAELGVPYLVGTIGVAALICLDGYWIRKSRAVLARMAEA